jgi:hypothetical protein
MYRPFILLVVVAVLTPHPANSDSAGRMRITAQAAVIELDALADGNRLVPQQALEFTLTVEPQCAPDTRAESISISAADTRRTYGSSDFTEKSVLETQLTIPRKQVSPIAVNGFCQTNREANLTSQELHIEDAFSAHISLRCAGEEKHSIIYMVQPLDLRLQCNAADDAAESSVDQDASSPSSIR